MKEQDSLDPTVHLRKLMQEIKDINPDVIEIELEGRIPMPLMPRDDAMNWPWMGPRVYEVTVRFNDGDFFITEPYEDPFEALNKTKERLGRWVIKME